MLSTFVFSVFSIWVAQLYEATGGQHDAGEVVIDEVAGFLVTMVWVPLTWPYVIAGFVLFRAFDVIKPFPISYIDQRVKGGVGVIGDDLLAGIASNVILQIVLQNLGKQEIVLQKFIRCKSYAIFSKMKTQ